MPQHGRPLHSRAAAKQLLGGFAISNEPLRLPLSLQTQQPAAYGQGAADASAHPQPPAATQPSHRHPASHQRGQSPAPVTSSADAKSFAHRGRPSRLPQSRRKDFRLQAAKRTCKQPAPAGPSSRTAQLTLALSPAVALQLFTSPDSGANRSQQAAWHPIPCREVYPASQTARTLGMCRAVFLGGTWPYPCMAHSMQGSQRPCIHSGHPQHPLHARLTAAMRPVVRGSCAWYVALSVTLAVPPRFKVHHTWISTWL